MAVITDYKVTSADINEVMVENQPDTLTGTSTANKRVFDAFPQRVAERHNQVVDYIAENFTDVNIDEQVKTLYKSMGWKE